MQEKTKSPPYSLWYNYAMNGQEERKKLVEEKIRAEDEKEAIATGDAREIVGGLLREKGYQREDIERDSEFSIAAGDKEDTASADFIIRLGGRRYMAIKCTMALESRQRHILSFSRVVDEYQIPYSVVTDGLKAYLMDTLSGRVISEDLDALPARDEAAKDIEALTFSKLPPERKDKETRILLAFECASCPKPGDG